MRDFICIVYFHLWSKYGNIRDKGTYLGSGKIYVMEAFRENS